MKIKSIFFLFVFIFIAMILKISSQYLYADDFRPSAPPRIPVVDYSEKGEHQLDVDYLRVKSQGYTLSGYGAGYNYIGAFGAKNQYGFNFGIGGYYLTGSDVEGGIWPVNLNFAKRFKENFIFLGGIHYAYSYVYIDIYDGLDVYVQQWGPLAGLKGSFKINNTAVFVPYYVARLDFVSIDIYNYASDSWNYYDDDILSHIIGFDIEFTGVSLGAMLDLFNTGDDDVINVHLTFEI